MVLFYFKQAGVLYCSACQNTNEATKSTDRVFWIRKFLFLFLTNFFDSVSITFQNIIKQTLRTTSFNEIRNGRNGLIILDFNDWYPYRKLRYCHLCCKSAFWNIPNIYTIPKNNQLSKKRCVWLFSLTSKWEKW